MAKNKVKFEGAFPADSRKVVNDNLADVGVCTTAFSQASDTTLNNVVGMVTDTLEPGTYRFSIFLAVTAGASGGLKIALKQSVANMLSSITARTAAYTASAIATTTFTTATDAASIIAATTAYTGAEVHGTLVVAPGKPGTLQLQAGQNASNGTATTVAAGSHMTFTKIG